MPYSASAGISLATQSASSNFYSLTDHNRQSINLDYEIVEKSQRMADGTMRKYVVAKKRKVSVSWQNIPSGTSTPFNPENTQNSYNGLTFTVDGYAGGAWMKSFYEDNLFKPVRLRIVHSDDDWSKNTASAFYPSTSSAAAEYMWAFITNFSYDVVKRYTLTDFVNVSMGFTEI